MSNGPDQAPAVAAPVGAPRVEPPPQVAVPEAPGAVRTPDKIAADGGSVAPDNRSEIPFDEAQALFGENVRQLLPQQARLTSALNPNLARPMIELVDGTKTTEQIITEQGEAIQKLSTDTSRPEAEKQTLLSQAFALKRGALELEQYQIVAVANGAGRRTNLEENARIRELGRRINSVDREMTTANLNEQDDPIANFALDLGAERPADPGESFRPVPAIAVLVERAIQSPDVRRQVIGNIAKLTNPAEGQPEGNEELKKVLAEWSAQLEEAGKNRDSKNAHERLKSRAISLSLLGALLMYLAMKYGQSANHPQQGGYG